MSLWFQKIEKHEIGQMRSLFQEAFMLLFFFNLSARIVNFNIFIFVLHLIKLNMLNFKTDLIEVLLIFLYNSNDQTSFTD